MYIPIEGEGTLNNYFLTFTIRINDG